MAKLILRSYPAERNGDFVSVAICTWGDNCPVAQKTVEIKRAADAAAELETYCEAVKATGKGAAVSMRIARGDRSPPGFKALGTGFRYVNVDKVEAAGAPAPVNA